MYSHLLSKAKPKLGHKSGISFLILRILWYFFFHISFSTLESCKFCFPWFVSQPNFVVYWTFVNLVVCCSALGRVKGNQHTSWFTEASEKRWETSTGMATMETALEMKSQHPFLRLCCGLASNLSPWRLASPECGQQLVPGRTRQKDLVV